MTNTVGTANKLCKFSSSVSKNGIFAHDGRSVSIFRLNTDDCINPGCPLQV
jgi:hypothetical protein